MPARRKLSLIILAITLGAIPVYLIGNAGAPLLDRDEPRYAQCSREMLLGSPEHPGSDFVVPRLRGQLRTAKPPLVYWSQAGVMNLLGDSAFSARLPSTLAALLTLTMWATAAWRIAGPGRAVWSTFILASSTLFVLTAKWCTTDAILLVFISASQLCLYALWRSRFSWPIAIGLGVAIGLAGLTKGPVVLGVMGMTLLFLQLLRVWNWWRSRNAATEVADQSQGLPRAGTLEYQSADHQSTRPATSSESVSSIAAWIAKLIVAVALVAAICVPWLMLIHQREPTFLPRIIGHDVVKRIQTGLEGHSAPPGYHLLTIWGTYFPWSVFIPLSLIFAWKRRHLPVIRFSLCAVVGPYLMFELIRTKLPHYLLPVFPWLSLLTADVIVRGLRGVVKDFNYRITTFFLVMWSLLPLGIGLLPWLATLKFQVPVLASTTLTAGGLVITLTIAVLFLRHRTRAGLIAMGVGNLLMLGLVHGVYLQHAGFLRASILVADDLKSRGLTGAGQVQMLDYKEPSLAFYQGGTIRENSNMKLTPTMAGKSPGHLVISDTVWANTNPAEQSKYEILNQFPCLNYADGLRVQTVMVIRRK